jgi:hypothetical protein
MKKIFSVAVVLCCAFLALGQSSQALPNTLHWQGKIYVQTLPFNGTGQFKFILHNGTNCIWSNTDGSACATMTEPASATPRTITQGLYSVDLGDTGAANMAAIPPSIFTGSTVYLRIWFNDGVNGFQQMAPDEILSAVPFAMFTNSVGTANVAQRMPSMTYAQRQAIATPLTGMMIYNTTSQNVNVYTGSGWLSLQSTPALSTWLPET